MTNNPGMAAPTTDPEVFCLTCKIVSEYIGLANQFTQDLSQALVPSMWILFMSLVGLWIVIRGIQLSLVTFQTTIMDVGKEFVFVIIAAVLLGGQGPELVNQIFVVALSTMGAGASVALQIGKQANIADSSMVIGAGMVELVRISERVIMEMIGLAWRIAGAWSFSSPLMILYALILIVPYFILWVAYFGQVVVSIFRVMMLVALSPFMMLGFAFGWGRDMLKTGIKSLISSFIVLFASTSVIAVLVYSLSNLGIDSTTTGDGIRDFAEITNPKFMLAVAMGWLGTAFLTEATGIANSITGSQFTNQAVATILTGAGTTALALGKAPGVKGLASTAAAGGGLAAGWTAHGAGMAAQYLMPGADKAYDGAKSVMDRIKRTEG